jgi:hypothetical protein
MKGGWRGSVRPEMDVSLELAYHVDQTGVHPANVDGEASR